MKRLIGCLLALAALALPAAALEPVSKPLSIYGYTYYAIDSAGTLWAWGDSFHGGITAERDPVDWEDAAAEMKNAVWTRGGFAVGLAIDREGVLWGWGSDFAGALRGQDASRGAVPLLDRVVSAESDEGGVRALRDDGTLWSWNAENPPHPVMDHVRAYSGYWAVLEDGTVLELRELELREEPRPVASHAAAAVYDWDDQAVLIWGEDGNLYRAWKDLDRNWFKPLELLLEDVVSLSANTAVTSDGTLWVWGYSLPLVRRDGALVRPTQGEAKRVLEGRPLRCLEGVRSAEIEEDTALVLLEDGSLVRIPAFDAWGLAQGDEMEPTTPLQKLLDQAGPVSWREADKSAPPPALVGPLNDTAWWMLALCVLPVAAAVAVYSRKK